MALNIIQLYEDFKIDYITSGSQVVKGWVNTACPYCGDHKHHLGYWDEKDMFSCWKCGRQPKYKVLMDILHKNYEDVKSICRKYADYSVEKFDNVAIDWRKELTLPPNYGKLMKSHCDYLRGRNFDPKQLQKDYDLVGSTNKAEFKYRKKIIIPIYYKHRLVSFTTRSTITDADFKIINCEVDKEIIRHKNVIYNFDSVSDVAIVNEGTSDAWAWGKELGVATLGIKFTQDQIQLLKGIPNIFIAFDSGEGESKAKERAERLADCLSIYQNVYLVQDFGCDPAELSPKDRLKIIKEIKKIVKINKSKSC